MVKMAEGEDTLTAKACAVQCRLCAQAQYVALKSQFLPPPAEGTALSVWLSVLSLAFLVSARNVELFVILIILSGSNF